MKKTLWQKSGTKMHPLVNQYIISPNLAEDNLLLAFDIKASIAHAKMLASIEILTKKEADQLVKTLKKILKLHQEGKFTLEQKNEDCHTAIENYLTQELGDLGKKIHTGRSRNDQVLVAMRLYSKEQISSLKKTLIKLSQTILSFAQKYEFVPMPGYTHTQQAMPSSIGQWAGSFVEMLLDDYQLLEAAHNLIDQNPLGSAAGFGTSLPLDREMVSQELGFKKPQINSLYCQNSRGKFESFCLSSLSQVMLSLGKIASDLICFTTYEFDFFAIDKSLTTGSSIMPQKQNLDIMEVLRANVSVVLSYQNQIQMAYQNLISGYHKDMKITKHALMEGFKITAQSLEIVDLLFQNLKPKEENLNKAFDTAIFATDEVNELVKKGMPFREAYKQVGENLDKIQTPDLLKNLQSKTHLGATGNLQLKKYDIFILHLLKKH